MNYFWIAGLWLLALSACSNHLSGGNGEAYNGGIKFEMSLLATRSELIQGSQKIRSFFPKETMCSPTLCGTREDEACHILRGLNASQRSQCADFLFNNLSEMTAIHTNGTTKLVLVEGELIVREGGVDRSVDAMTAAGPGGDIFFSVDSLSRMDSLGRLALLVHESGHKLSVPIRDEGPQGSFESGRELLDTVGAAFVVMAKLREGLGFFLLNAQRYYANNQGEYCRFPDRAQWELAGGPLTDTNVVTLIGPPPTFVFRSTCSLRGFYSISGVGYYADDTGRYCHFDTYRDWVDYGGPTNPKENRTYLMQSPYMIDLGRCPRKY